MAATMDRRAPPLDGDGDGGSASHGRRPRGDLDSYIIGAAKRVRDRIRTVIGGDVPVPRPVPSEKRRDLPDFLSPCARSVIDGPAVTSFEFYELKQELQSALKEVDASLKADAKEKQLSNYIGTESKMLSDWIHSYSDDVKFALEVGVRCNKISSQNAADLITLMEKMDETMIQKIVRNGKSLHKLSEVRARFGYNSHSGSLLSRLRGYVDLYFMIRDIIDSLRQGPGLFKNIGKDSKGLLYNDYMSSNLRVDPQPNVDQSIVAGWGLENQNVVKRLLLNLKRDDTNVAFSGNLNDLNPALLLKVTMDQFLGAQTKGVLYLPIPYRNTKFELQSLHRFAGFTASAGLRPNPALEFSCLLGTKTINCGGMFEVDTKTSECKRYCTGLSVSIASSSLGVTLNNK